MQRPWYEATRVSNQNFDPGISTLHFFDFLAQAIYTQSCICVLQFDSIRASIFICTYLKVGSKDIIVRKQAPYRFVVDIYPLKAKRY